MAKSEVDETCDARTATLSPADASLHAHVSVPVTDIDPALTAESVMETDTVTVAPAGSVPIVQTFAVHVPCDAVAELIGTVAVPFLAISVSLTPEAAAAGALATLNVYVRGVPSVTAAGPIPPTAIDGRGVGPTMGRDTVAVSSLAPHEHEMVAVTVAEPGLPAVSVME